MHLKLWNHYPLFRREGGSWLQPRRRGRQGGEGWTEVGVLSLLLLALCKRRRRSIKRGELFEVVSQNDW